MREDFIRSLLEKSVDSGKGGRAKNLKIYVQFFSPNVVSFIEKERKPIDGLDNEFIFHVDGYDAYFDQWEWGVVLYHCLEEDGTNKIEQFIKNNREIKDPWVGREDFEKLSNLYVSDGGNICIERVFFEPHNDYSGYGMSLQVRGKKTKTVIKKIESEYALLPRKIGIVIEEGSDGLLKFEMTNKGRISFSSGTVAGQMLVISKFVDFIKTCDRKYDLKQSKKIDLSTDISVRKTNDAFKIQMPSCKKIGVSLEARNAAVIEMLTTGNGADGYIGIPLGLDRASVLDLKDRKMFQVTIIEDTLYVYSENPSEVQSTLRRLVSNMASHIDPELQFEMVPLSSG